jgi:hypothetical protein
MLGATADGHRKHTKFPAAFHGHRVSRRAVQMPTLQGSSRHSEANIDCANSIVPRHPDENLQNIPDL